MAESSITLHLSRILTRFVNFLQISVKVKLLSPVWLFATPWTIAHQALPSMGFSRQEYWSGLPFPSPGDLPNPGIELRSPTLQADALTSEPPGKPKQYQDGATWNGALQLIFCGKCDASWKKKITLKILYHLSPAEKIGILVKVSEKSHSKTLACHWLTQVLPR